MKPMSPITLADSPSIITHTPKGSSFVTNLCGLLGLDGEAVEYVVVLVACDLDDLADEDSVGADDIPALLDLQPRDRISHARSSPDRRAETSAGWIPALRRS